jgi:predicted nucleic acid-binding protein
MSINPLNDISKVYLEQVVTQEVELDEGITLKDYKKKRSALKQKERLLLDVEQVFIIQKEHQKEQQEEMLLMEKQVTVEH